MQSPTNKMCGHLIQTFWASEGCSLAGVADTGQDHRTWSAHAGLMLAIKPMITPEHKYLLFH